VVAKAHDSSGRGGESDDNLRQEQERLERIKCGFVNIERLDGKIAT
jgi:hypothetical protein